MSEMIDGYVADVMKGKINISTPISITEYDSCSLPEPNKKCKTNNMEDWNMTVLADESPVEYAKIVRCKDCRFAEYDISCDEYECMATGCGLFYNGDFYCADGERRESKVKKCFDIPKEVAEILLEDTERRTEDDD